MNARMLATLALALSLPVGAAVRAEAPRPRDPGTARDNDAQLHADVVRAVNTYPRLTIFDDITVHVQNGAVTLSGKVTMRFKRTELSKRIEAVDGVRTLRNEVDVLPVSREDDELRTRVARAIYGDPAFHRYAALPRPPIHIIVENGRVTLTGVVPTDVDRALARSLAAGQGARSMTCALRTAGPS